MRVSRNDVMTINREIPIITSKLNDHIMSGALI